MTHDDWVNIWADGAIRILKREHRKVSVGYLSQLLGVDAPRGGLQALDRRGAYVQHCEWAIFVSLREWYPAGSFRQGKRGRAVRCEEDRPKPWQRDIDQMTRRARLRKEKQR